MIPSLSLKSKIEEAGFLPTELALFKITYQYSNSLDERIRACEYFSNECEDSKIRLWASRLHSHLTEGYNKFIAGGKDIIYLVSIKEGRCNPEIYLATSYIDAYNKLNAYLLSYYEDDIENYKDILELSITKRRLYSSDNPNWENELEEYLWFNIKGEPSNLYFSADDIDPDIYDFVVDSNNWPYITFPEFFKDGDLVSFSGDVSNPKISDCGMVLYNGSEYHNDSMAYVVWLNGECVNKERINERMDFGYPIVLERHRHVPFTELNILDITKVDSKIKAKYKLLRSFYESYKLEDKG